MDLRGVTTPKRGHDPTNWEPPSPVCLFFFLLDSTAWCFLGRRSFFCFFFYKKFNDFFFSSIEQWTKRCRCGALDRTERRFISDGHEWIDTRASQCVCVCVCVCAFNIWRLNARREEIIGGRLNGSSIQSHYGRHWEATERLIGPIAAAPLRGGAVDPLPDTPTPLSLRQRRHQRHPISIFI